MINNQTLLRGQLVVPQMLFLYPPMDDFHFSNIANKQFYALKPLRNPHWYFDSNGFVKSVIYLLIIFSKIFEIIGKILTSQEPFLKTAAISPFLKIAGNLPLIIVSFKKSQIYAEEISAFSFNISLVDFLAFNLLISLKTSLLVLFSHLILIRQKVIV